jgi:hypothetical protein
VIEQVGSGQSRRTARPRAVDRHADPVPRFNALRDADARAPREGGAAVVVDVRPARCWRSRTADYDPNTRAQLTGAQLRNRAITDTFEPGSTMKAFSVAMALEARPVPAGHDVDTSPGQLHDRFSATIGDAHRYGPLTVEQVLQKSSNVGTVKMALTMPPAADVGRLHVARLRAAAADRLPRARSRARAARTRPEADRAGDDVVRARHLGVADADGARVPVFARDGE